MIATGDRRERETATAPIATDAPSPKAQRTVRRKIIRETAAFAGRLEEACQRNPHVPEKNYGQLTWLKRQLEERHNEAVSLETVRKWLAGESRPRPDKIRLLAELLDVDEAWLSLGHQLDRKPRELRLRNAEVRGIVNVVVGVIQMAGGSPAFPGDDDRRAKEQQIDLYAIIRGAHYAFHVSLAKQEGEQWQFVVPADYQGVFQMGVIADSDTAFRFVDLNHLIAKGSTVSGSEYIEVLVREDAVEEREISGFREKL